MIISVWCVGIFYTILGMTIPLINLRYVNPGVTFMMASHADLKPRTWVPLSKISHQLQSAVIAAEDGRFYQHQGVDWEEMQKSFEKDWKKKKYLRGSSTISMQLIKNLYLPRQKMLMRKVVEVVLTLWMEQWVPKDRILEIYLNSIEWGDGVYGVEMASQHYFKKNASQLSNQEALFLASIIPNPKRWSQASKVVKRREKIISRRLGQKDSHEVVKAKPTEIPEPVSPSPPPESPPADVGTDEESDSLPPEPSEATPDTPTSSP